MAKETAKPRYGVKNVQGVSIEDRKVGSGPQAKKGSRVDMRYIGKLESGKIFDGMFTIPNVFLSGFSNKRTNGNNRPNSEQERKTV